VNVHEDGRTLSLVAVGDNRIGKGLFFLRVRLKTSSRIAELSQHEADGGEFQEGESAAVEIFPVLGETAAAIEPSNGALDDPTLG
jgi:hypothetical protein